MADARFIPGKDPIPIARDAAARGVGKAAEHVLGEARRIVPHEEGTLERSGRASAEQSGTTARAAVSFDTPYAVVQHEQTRYRHKKGRRAKYLEGPLNAEQGKAQAIIAAELRGEL